MPRQTISENFRNEHNLEGGAEFGLFFLTFSHETLSENVYIVTDIIDYVYDGNTYTGIPLEIEVFTDTDAAPSANVRIQNIDRRLGEILRGIDTPLKLSFKIILSSQFNQNVIPRTAIGTPHVEYYVPYCELKETNGDVVSISGKIQIIDFTQETFPQAFATKSKFPGYFIG